MIRFLNVYTISGFAALGGVLLGLDISSVSGILGTDQYKNYYGNPLGMRQGGITSAMAAGSILGALSSSFLGDKLSRKVAIQCGMIFWCIGAAVQSTSNGIEMLAVGRAIAGICVGLTSSLVPIYQSEIAPRRFRGRIVALQQLAITSGILIQYLVEYGCSFLDSEFSLSQPLSCLSASSGSPARRGGSRAMIEGDINDPLVLAEYKEIEDQIHLERCEGSNSLQELFSKKMRSRVFLSMSIQVWSQLCGANVINYYIVYVLKSGGVANSMLLGSIPYIIEMLMTIPCIVWTDQWGRRPSLLIGSIVMGFWLYVVGGLLMQYGEPNPVRNQPYTWILVDHPAATRAIQSCCYLFIGAFGATWGPVGWMYPPEIVPIRIRAKSVSLATACNWATNLVLGISVPPLLRSISWRMFFIFGSFNIMAFIHVLFAAPETKQRTLEEMDEIFEHGGPLWKSFLNKGDTNILDKLADDIEMGILRIHRPIR
ncbi:general substrate transporter [Lipomyces doorenjongii]|uniref:general substrate transporter n=1 Tax=Lipomyces doorenjongii TaxID=383834 RepID=UPI0034CFCF54